MACMFDFATLVCIDSPKMPACSSHVLRISCVGSEVAVKQGPGFMEWQQTIPGRPAGNLGCGLVGSLVN